MKDLEESQFKSGLMREESLLTSWLSLEAKWKYFRVEKDLPLTKMEIRGTKGAQPTKYVTKAFLFLVMEFPKNIFSKWKDPVILIVRQSMRLCLPPLWTQMIVLFL